MGEIYNISLNDNHIQHTTSEQHQLNDSLHDDNNIDNSITVYAITGGSGYIGERLALTLLQRSAYNYVILLDVISSSCPFLAKHSDRCMYRYCDITNQDSVHLAFEEYGIHNDNNNSNATATQKTYPISCVFHVASFGMSGSNMLNAKQTERVNITGTQHIIHECIQRNINRLIYVSTYNVTFAGEPIYPYMTESMPYADIHRHCDAYSRTKTIAEQLVLHANQHMCADQSTTLHTAAIRPAAIWGDAERTHIPRIINTLRNGVGALFAVGEIRALSDWVYYKNLIHALILCSEGVTSLASGQAYFISDNYPINTFQFLKQFAHGLGYRYCFITYIPTRVMLYVARFVEYGYHYVNQYIPHEPYLTSTEVLKIGIHHYASIDKARKHLNYEPIVTHHDAMKSTIEWFLRHGYGCNQESPIQRLMRLLAYIIINYKRIFRWIFYILIVKWLYRKYVSHHYTV